MPGAIARDPAGQDLTSFSNVSFQAPDVLVIDVLDLVDTEMTDFSSPAESSLHCYRPVYCQIRRAPCFTPGSNSR